MLYEVITQTQATGFHALIALLQEGQEAGVFKKEDPMLQAAVVWSMVHGVSNLLIDGHLMIQDNIEAIFEMGTRTLIEGIRITSYNVCYTKLLRIFGQKAMPSIFFKEMWEMVRKGQTWRGEIKNNTMQGEEHWVDIVVLPFFDANGTITQYRNNFV